VVDGVGTWALGPVQELVLAGSQGLEVLAPAPAPWSLSLSRVGPQARVFASFFDFRGALLLNTLLDTGARSPAPSGAASARVFVLQQPGVFRGGSLNLEVRAENAREPRLEQNIAAELGVDAADHALTIRLKPGEVYHLAASGRDLVVMLTLERSRPVARDNDSNSALLPSRTQVLVKAGGGFDFSGVTSVLVTVPAGAGDGKPVPAAVSVSKATPQQAGAVKRASRHD
jgi:hypothetical protein